MCGIAGLFHYHSRTQAAPEVVESMCVPIRHRGPDDMGVLVDGPAGIGMTRLSIVDLAHGHQPIFNEDRTVAVVCNGEIYNYPELRRSLESRGHRFGTNSDTEAIVHLYEEHGADFVEHLEGMFGVAVLDRSQQRIVLARDPLGIKPLHYFSRNGLFAFGSEIKSLLQVDPQARAIDPTALDAYLSLSYIPAPRTIFEGIFKLRPGTCAVVDADGFRTRQYWQPPFPRRGTRRPIGREDAIRQLQAGLRESVRSHLLADVPVGVFLSGGIDSSLVLALMSEQTSGVKSFSIGFRDASYNELPQARKVARRFGAEHSEFVVESHHATALPDLIGYLDEPFGDLSALPVYFLSRLAASHVKTVLAGDGGDELFAGYLTYVADRLARTYGRVPRLIRNGVIRPAVHRLPTSHKKVSFDYKAKRFVDIAGDAELRRHVRWKEIFSPSEKTRLYSSEYLADHDVVDPFEELERHFTEAQNLEFLDRFLYLDTTVYLADDILTKVDRMSMAHSLEVRVPLLDRRVVELATQIPPRLKMKGLRTKYVLKEAARGILPPEVLNRKKAGFIFPASIWLRHALWDYANDTLSETRLRRMGIFDPARVQQLLTRHRSGERDLARPIWNLVAFAEWYARYFEASGAARMSTPACEDRESGNLRRPAPAA